MEKKVNKWIEENGCPEYCKYCFCNDVCPKGMVCYGGEPIEPYCAGHEAEDFLDIDAITKDIEDGEIEI